MRYSHTYPAYCFSLILALTSCAPAYRNITPFPGDKGIIMSDSLSKDGIFIAYGYGLLAASGTRKLARTEWQTGHHLIALEIRNHRSDTFWIREDLQFISGQDTLVSLTLVEAMTLLSHENPERWKESIEVDAPGAMFALDFFNTLKQVRSSLSFLNDMTNYYFDPGKLLPGDTLYGLLMLQVEPDRKLDFATKKI